MSNGESMAEAMAEIAQSIRATPNNRRRLKSGTFWERLGCKKRTPKQIDRVHELLKHHGVTASLRHRHSMDELPTVALGSENKSDWLVLTCNESASMASRADGSGTEPVSVTTPLDSSFEKLLQRRFGSEGEVVTFFLRPLFELLGYEDPDFAIGHPVEMHFGCEKLTKHADLVLFKRDDQNNNIKKPDNVLVLAEAKEKLDKPIHGDDVGQARSYAMWLSPVYYFVTNGYEVEVYLYRMTVAKDEPAVICFKRADLKQRWTELYKLLCKKRVMEVKEKRQQIIAELQKL